MSHIYNGNCEVCRAVYEIAEKEGIVLLEESDQPLAEQNKNIEALLSNHN